MCFVRFGGILLTCAVLTFLVGCASSQVDDRRVISPESLAIVGPLLEEIDRDEEVELSRKEGDVASSFDEPPSKEEMVKETKPAEAVVATVSSPKPVVNTKPIVEALVRVDNVAKAEKATIEEKTTNDIAIKGVVTGTISLWANEEKSLSPAGIIVTLKPIDGRQVPDVAEAPSTHVVDMENKTYSPRFLTIKSHDRVSFINKDEIKHNVFSSSGKNAFDLGTYDAGKRREVELVSEGIVKVYCNIHAEMAAFIAVNREGLSGVTDKDGKFEIEGVPIGQYELKAWHIRGEASQDITVISNRTTTVDTSIDVSSYKRTKHKNKFGKNYNKNADIFDDEFY